MAIKLNIIVAACEGMGIGKDNYIPWRLKTYMDFFTRITSTTIDKNKKNIVIMGRGTWNSILEPLHNRISCVLSSSDLKLKKYINDVYAFKSLKQCLEALESPEFQELFETVWVIGGSNIFKESMESNKFHRLYLMKVMKSFDCDTFLQIPNDLITISDPAVPVGVQREDDIEFIYHVYERPTVTAS